MGLPHSSIFEPLPRQKAVVTAAAGALFTIGLAGGGALVVSSPARGGASAGGHVAPPSDGVMGFVVQQFTPPIVPDATACPTGLSPKMRDVYLQSVSASERERLLQKENEPELTRKWQAETFGPGGTNVCSQPDMFDRALQRTVQSNVAWGLDLDEDGGKSRAGETSCAQQDFTSPVGEAGIDNQEYRAMGCTQEWRGIDGTGAEAERALSQFHKSGEWTQVILLRGVDSLENDTNVEVIYANTTDRPEIDSKGNFLAGQSFTVSNKGARHRNVLWGKIVDGVLTTEPANILLAQTWGQGGARDIRGNRTTYDYRQARLRLTFQPDGTASGLVGGYRPVFDVIISPALGGAGSAVVAGIDCASHLATLKKLADGLRDPKTGQCNGVSSAMRIVAVPAFVNDIAPAHVAGVVR